MLQCESFVSGMQWFSSVQMRPMRHFVAATKIYEDYDADDNDIMTLMVDLFECVQYRPGVCPVTA